MSLYGSKPGFAVTFSKILGFLTKNCGRPGNGLNDELENVQKRAARFLTGNYSYETGSMTGILEELKWETLQ